MDSRTSVQPHFEHFFGKPTSDGRREISFILRHTTVAIFVGDGQSFSSAQRAYSRRPYTNNALPAETATYCLPPTA